MHMGINKKWESKKAPAIEVCETNC